MATRHDLADPEAQTEGSWFTDCAKVSKNGDENNQAYEASQREEAAEYGDSSAMYWKLYGSEAEISDQKLVDTLTSDTTAMSILNGIFSSIIASFIIQTSQALQPNNNSQETVCLLSQLVPQENSTQQSSPYCPDPSFSGAPTEAVIRSNILLLISFFLAMISVLACGLIQQWCHEFMKCAYPRAAPHKRGRVRTYLFQGLNRFYIRRFMYGVHGLLHISVFLFFCGLSDYLRYLYPRVGMVSWYCVIALMVAYATLSVFPLVIGNCPYQTALTPPLLFGSTLLLFACRTTLRRLCPSYYRTYLRREELHFSKNRYLMEKANQSAAHLDPYAMKWLFTDDDFDDSDMDKFLEGLPGYIHSRITSKQKLPDVLTAPYVLRRIREHLLTCATATEPSEQARIKRVSACIDSLRVILHLRTSSEPPMNPDEEKSLRMYMESIVDGLNTLCDKPDEIRDLHAFCVRALAFQGFLNRCLEPARVGSPNVKVPGHFIPLYSFFSSKNTLQKQHQAPAEVSDEKEHPGDSDDTMWRVLLHDGPFINLTLLARAILLHDYVDVHPSSLLFCWKTLDILRSELRISRAEISDSSLALFNIIHKKTRRRVEAEEPGFSVLPLLEILDAVDGGRRLSIVFRDHPNPRHRSKANLVFAKDHLRNPELFQEFAHCLPHFVTKHPEKSIELMEGLVRFDHLWISLQVHLSNSLQPNAFIPATMRVFNTCCTIIDAAFVALENSNVDWRTPDFGSLAHYFDLFVTDCFQGMFVERAIGFRVGLIKARFCKAVLAQFLDEFNREGSVVFRSHWDVASLARIFYSLSVGSDADVEFWKSFVDGGPIGDILLAKTYTTLHMAKRDGPLLNFCRLGHLGMMAVPFEGSGLKDTDFQKLLDLLQKTMEDVSLPLAHASIPVWEELRQLRDEVADACERISNEDEVVHIFERRSKVDKANLIALLEKINVVYHHCPLSVQERPPVDHLQAQASETSTIVQPNLPSMSLIPGNDRSSYASASATIIEEQHDNSLAQEADFRGVTPARSHNSRGEFANVYRNPYPHLPTQINPSGTIARPFSASFLPNLFPHLGRPDFSPGIPSAHLPLPHMRYNSQHHRTSVYYPPQRDTATCQSATLLSLRSPTRMLSNPSNIWFGPSSSDAVYWSSSTTFPEDVADLGCSEEQV